MRLWSVHPRYLDRQALIACWREGLLAQSVIGKVSGGYSRHPQLQRFRQSAAPLRSIGAFLTGLVAEADARGYAFDRSKILDPGPAAPLPLNRAQLEYEWAHLGAKLERRSPEWGARLAAAGEPSPHPLFTVVPGPIEPWERPSPPVPAPLPPLAE